MKLLMKEDTTNSNPAADTVAAATIVPIFHHPFGEGSIQAIRPRRAPPPCSLVHVRRLPHTLNSSPTYPISIPFNDDIGVIGLSEFDVLEVVEREKVVRHLWNVYTLAAGSIRLPRFWQQAFEAAFKSLVSDAEAVRDAAVEEIARMSLGAVDLARSMETQVGVRDH